MFGWRNEVLEVYVGQDGRFSFIYQSFLQQLEYLYHLPTPHTSLHFHLRSSTTKLDPPKMTKAWKRHMWSCSRQSTS